MDRKKAVFLAISILAMLTLLTGGLFGEGNPEDNAYRYLSVFTEVFSLVRENYVDTVEQEQLVEGAFDGVTDAIDEYSYYVSPQNIKEYQKDPGNDWDGLGLIVSKRLGYAYVIAPVPGSPSAEAGIEPGDFIERVNGELTSDMPIWKVRNILRGADETPVDLLLVRRGMSEREKFVVTPAAYEITPPSLKLLDDGIAHLAIPFFGPGSSEAVAGLLEKVIEAGSKKLLLDLRGNAGGVIQEGIEVADLLLDAGIITTLEGRRIEAKKWEANRSVQFDGEIIVMADNGTAAGAEILAAAISKNGRGKIVGVTTFGRAFEQRFIELESGGGLNVTVGFYTDPTLESIHKHGVEPDESLNLTLFMLQDEDDEDRDVFLEQGLAAFGKTKEAVN